MYLNSILLSSVSFNTLVAHGVRSDSKLLLLKTMQKCACTHWQSSFEYSSCWYKTNNLCLHTHTLAIKFRVFLVVQDKKLMPTPYGTINAHGSA